jgi:hypothetical protein
LFIFIPSPTPSFKEVGEVQKRSLSRVRSLSRGLCELKTNSENRKMSDAVVPENCCGDINPSGNPSLTVYNNDVVIKLFSPCHLYGELSDANIIDALLDL